MGLGQRKGKHATKDVLQCFSFNGSNDAAKYFYYEFIGWLKQTLMVVLRIISRR